MWPQPNHAFPLPINLTPASYPQRLPHMQSEYTTFRHMSQHLMHVISEKPVPNLPQLVVRTPTPPCLVAVLSSFALMTEPPNVGSDLVVRQDLYRLVLRMSEEHVARRPSPASRTTLDRVGAD